MIKKISKALKYASEMHKNQKSKNEKTPYINHPIDVMNILVEAGIENTNILLTAVLHDVIEDTEGTYEDIEDMFGATVARMVLECSDDKAAPRWKIKKEQIEKIADNSDEVILVKIADKISNLKSISFPDSQPTKWDDNKIIGYAVWAKKVVTLVLDKNTELKNIFLDIYKALADKYNIKEKDEPVLLDRYMSNLK